MKNVILLFVILLVAISAYADNAAKLEKLASDVTRRIRGAQLRDKEQYVKSDRQQCADNALSTLKDIQEAKYLSMLFKARVARQRDTLRWYKKNFKLIRTLTQASLDHNVVIRKNAVKALDQFKKVQKQELKKRMNRIQKSVTLLKKHNSFFSYVTPFTPSKVVDDERFFLSFIEEEVNVEDSTDMSIEDVIMSKISADQELGATEGFNPYALRILHNVAGELDDHRRKITAYQRYMESTCKTIEPFTQNLGLSNPLSYVDVAPLQVSLSEAYAKVQIAEAAYKNAKDASKAMQSILKQYNDALHSLKEDCNIQNEAFKQRSLTRKSSIELIETRVLPNIVAYGDILGPAEAADLSKSIYNVDPNIHINGKWSPWMQTECDAPCGMGRTTLYRKCTNPAPSNGGSDCSGAVFIKNYPCNIGMCTTDTLQKYDEKVRLDKLKIAKQVGIAKRELMRELAEADADAEIAGEINPFVPILQDGIRSLVKPFSVKVPVYQPYVEISPHVEIVPSKPTRIPFIPALRSDHVLLHNTGVTVRGRRRRRHGKRGVRGQLHVSTSIAEPIKVKEVKAGKVIMGNKPTALLEEEASFLEKGEEVIIKKLEDKQKASIKKAITAEKDITKTLKHEAKLAADAVKNFGKPAPAEKKTSFDHIFEKNVATSIKATRDAENASKDAIEASKHATKLIKNGKGFVLKDAEEQAKIDAESAALAAAQAAAKAKRIAEKKALKEKIAAEKKALKAKRIAEEKARVEAKKAALRKLYPKFQKFSDVKKTRARLGAEFKNARVYGDSAVAVEHDVVQTYVKRDGKFEATLPLHALTTKFGRRAMLSDTGKSGIFCSRFKCKLFGLTEQVNYTLNEKAPIISLGWKVIDSVLPRGKLIQNPNPVVSSAFEKVYTVEKCKIYTYDVKAKTTVTTRVDDYTCKKMGWMSGHKNGATRLTLSPSGNRLAISGGCGNSSYCNTAKNKFGVAFVYNTKAMELKPLKIKITGIPAIKDVALTNKGNVVAFQGTGSNSLVVVKHKGKYIVRP